MPKGRPRGAGPAGDLVTTAAFLDQFALSALDDLPRELDELECGGTVSRATPTAERDGEPGAPTPTSDVVEAPAS
jgi:hypothetical protein